MAKTGRRAAGSKAGRLSCALLLGLACIAHAFAAGSVPHLSQYGHSVWRTQDGQFNSPNEIAQTRDGYLWIGTDTGLVRFDGVRFVPWNTFAGVSIAAWAINAVVAATDGSLWIASNQRVARIKDGRLTRYDTPGRAVDLIEDDDGVIWFVQTRVHDNSGSLCSITRDKLHCFAKADLPLRYISVVKQRKEGGLWLGSSEGLCAWSPGRAAECFLQEALKPLAGLLGVGAVLTSSDGTCWVGIGRAGPDFGLGQLVHGKWESFQAPGLDGRTLQVTALLEDRDGSIWVGTFNQGVYRIRKERTEHFAIENGLSGNSAFALFEDREGTVWVATSSGLDAFRRLPVQVFSTREGLAADAVDAVLPARDGTVWIGGVDLMRVVEGQVVPAPSATLFRDQAVTSLLEDHSGLLWVGIAKTLNVFEHGKLKKITAADGTDLGPIAFIVEDTRHDVWAVRPVGVSRIFRIRDQVVVQELDPARFAAPTAVAADPESGIWFGYNNGSISLFRDGDLKTFAADGVGGAVYGLLPEAHDTILAATSNGLLVQRLASRRLLDVAHGLPCASMKAVLRDARRSVWLSASCGLIAIEEADLERWLQNPDEKIRVRLFDVTDGVQPGIGSFAPRAAVAPDGRLWFATSKVALTIDPAGLGSPTEALPVRIEEVTADRTVFQSDGPLTLAPRTRDIDIRYTALSFAVPQKIRFQFQLEGRDPGWRDAGTLRQAFYTDLPPRGYRFRVRASNGDGTWTEAATPLEFEIPPAYYQTSWFAALCFLFGAAALYGFYVVKLREVAATARDRALVKSDERERIARELHDTLLQGTQGLIYGVQAAANRVAPDEPVRDLLEQALARADRVMAEGRDRIQDLRAADEGDGDGDLPRTLAAVGEELAQGSAVEFRVIVEGRPRALTAGVREEARGIAREALLNAFRHARARAIEIQIIYADDGVRVRVRDDGIGIGVDGVGAGAMSRPGHWGLPGMRERARAIGARLDMWSRPGAGTEVELRVPAAVAYLRRAPRPRLFPLGFRLGEKG